MYNAGDFDTTETVILPLNTFTSDDPTASCTVTNLAAGDVEIHKDGSTTQRSSDSGVTVTIDFDSITGNHIISIDLSDNTDAGFYANGSRYLVRVEGITVDGGTINAWIGGFSIGCTLRPATAGRTVVVDADGLVDANTVKSGPSGSGTAQTANDNGADINAILTDTNELQTDDIPTLIAALPTASENRTEMDSNSTQLAAIVADTNELQTDLTNGGRLDLILDELTAQGDTNEGKIDTIDGIVDNIITDTNELQTDWTNGGRLDLIIDELTTQGDTNEGKLDIITTDTNELQTDLTNGGRLDLILDELTTQGDTNEGKLDTVITDTNELQTDWTNGGRLDLILDELTTQGDTNEGKIDTIDTNVDAILVDTGTTLPATLAGLNDISAADVNAQVLDVVNTDTFAEPGQEAPTATTTLVDKIGYLYKFLRNKIDNDGTTIQVYDDAGTTVDQKATVGEAAGTVTRGEFGTGP